MRWQAGLTEKCPMGNGNPPPTRVWREDEVETPPSRVWSEGRVRGSRTPTESPTCIWGEGGGEENVSGAKEGVGGERRVVGQRGTR